MSKIYLASEFTEESQMFLFACAFWVVSSDLEIEPNEHRWLAQQFGEDRFIEWQNKLLDLDEQSFLTYFRMLSGSIDIADRDVILSGLHTWLAECAWSDGVLSDEEKLAIHAIEKIVKEAKGSSSNDKAKEYLRFLDKDSGERLIVSKRCTKCHTVKLGNRRNFGGTPKGNLRGACRSCVCKKVSQYNKNHPDQVRSRDAKRAKLSHDAEGLYTSEDIKKIRLDLDDKCFYCDEPLYGKGEVEHLIPLSRGGDNHTSNLTLACYLCNGEKHKKTVHEYLEYRKMRGWKISSRHAEFCG